LDFSSVFRERVAECKNSLGISENSHSIFQNGLPEMPPINSFFMWNFLKIQWQCFCSVKSRRLYQNGACAQLHLAWALVQLKPI
jgi:hypothetical protein